MFDNSKDILVAWKKVSKSGQAYFSGKFKVGDEMKDVVIFIGNGGDENRPYIKMVESEPKEPKEGRVPTSEIPF